MKKLEILRVKYKNTLSVGQQPIEIFLNRCHKSLVTGKNGDGKSTFIEALTFGIFGRPFRDIKKGQLINSMNKKDQLVEVDIRFNGSLFEVRRGQKPTIFEIKRDGVPLDESASAKDFQEYFEQLIGLNYNSFKQIIVLGTAGYTPFMALTAPNRRKLVEDLLEITVLADMDKLNKTAIRELNTAQSLCDQRIQHLNIQIKTHQDHDEKQKRLSGDNLIRLNKMYDEQVAIVNANKDKAIAHSEKINAIISPPDLTTEIGRIQRDLAVHDQKCHQYDKVLHLYNTGGVCPTCIQPLSNPQLVGQIKARRDAEDTAAHTLTASLNSAQDDQRLYLSAVNQIRTLQSEQTQFKSAAVAAVGQAKKIKALIEEASKEYVDNSQQIQALQDDLNAEYTNKADMVMDKYRRGCITEMLKDSGIKGAIVQKYVPLFNKYINEYLQIMGADYVFTLNQEFGESIKSRGREDFSYASFSQGEKARIDIALLFTWRKIASAVTGVNISTLILDEVADGATDAEGVKAIQQILNSIPDLNCFIISHRDHNPDDYGQHLKMRKVGRFSVLETISNA